MSDLFSDAASQRAGEIAPLAQRLRPRTLEELVGQKHVLGEGSALRQAIAEDRVRSSIFHGPPGSGKTTLARVQVYELETLSPEEMAVVVRRGLSEVGGEAADDVIDLIVRRAGGDARNALNIVELASETASGAITEENVEDAARKRPVVYDKASDAHYDFTSAFIKSMRGSDPDAAVFYLAAMLEGGEDARFIARRMIVLASEDVGNADPQALVVAVAAAQAVEHVGLPEARLNLAQAAIYLALAPKSNASYVAIKEATADV